MTKEVMKLIDERTGEMKCSVCGAVHFACREDGRHYPPESLCASMAAGQKIWTDSDFSRLAAIILGNIPIQPMKFFIFTTIFSN